MTVETQEQIFQAKDGFQFHRIIGGENHGSVKVHIVKDNVLIWGTLFTAAEWASVVATMSALGETGTTFRMFEAMQK